MKIEITDAYQATTYIVLSARVHDCTDIKEAIKAVEFVDNPDEWELCGTKQGLYNKVYDECERLKKEINDLSKRNKAQETLIKDLYRIAVT